MSTADPSTSRSSLSGADLAIFVLFFLSGAGALIYEVVWTRQLATVFGGSAFAISTVLAAFMAGLALGSYTLGRRIDRRGHPLKVYAILEAGIAVWALLLPVFLAVLNGVYSALYQNLNPGFHALSLIRFVFCFLLLLVPTTFMGGTLPVLGKLLVRRGTGLATRAGWLYATNTAGAVLGVAAGGFLLMPALGIQGATLLAVGINLGVAALAWLLSGRYPLGQAEAPVTVVPEAGPGHPVVEPAVRRAALVVYAASGFAALAVEVAWTKTLSMLLGTTTYAFTAMLTTFLIGLTVGSLLFARLADRTRHPGPLLAVVQIGVAVTVLMSVPILARLPQFYVDGFPALSSSWLSLEAFRIGLAASAMLLPTLLMGGTFPLVTRLFVSRDRTGGNLGTLLAANTTGAILGSFVAGFVLIPWIGRQMTILTAIGMNLAAVLVLLSAMRWRTVPTVSRWALAAVSVLLIPAAVGAWSPWDPRVMSSGAYLYASKYSRYASIEDALEGHDLLYYRESTEGTVSVWHRGFSTWLRNNGKTDASSHGDILTQSLLGHLPALYRGGQFDRALVIGLGSGITPGALLTYDTRQVQTVDIMPGMDRAARYFSLRNRDCLDDPRHELILGDGRNHLLLSDRSYDVIVSEPSNPWIAGVGSLFTREFFELAQQRLSPGGVLCQWVQTYDFSPDDLRTVLGTVLDVFPHLHVWFGTDRDLLLVASSDPLRLDQAAIEAQLAQRPGEDLASIEILPFTQILSQFLTDESGAREFVGDWTRRVTDDNLYLEYAVPRHLADPMVGLRVTTFAPYETSPWSFVDADGEADVEGWRDYRATRNLAARLLEANDVPEELGSRSEALNWALETTPDSRMIRDLMGKDLLAAAGAALGSYQEEVADGILHRVLEVGLVPEQAQACLILGQMQMAAERVDRAADYWKAALELEPNFTNAQHRLGVIAAMAGDRVAARQRFQAVVERAPSDVEAWSELAKLDMLEENWDRASEHVARILEIDPRRIDALMNQGVIWLKNGEIERAGTRFREVLVREPWRSEAAYNLALTAENLGRFGEAGRAWAHYLRFRPDDVGAMNSLAWVLATHLDRPADAETWAQRALAGSEPTADYLDTLAEALFRQGKRSEAVRTAELALTLEDTEYYREQLSRFRTGGRP